MTTDNRIEKKAWLHVAHLWIRLGLGLEQFFFGGGAMDDTDPLDAVPTDWPQTKRQRGAVVARACKKARAVQRKESLEIDKARPATLFCCRTKPTKAAFVSV